MKISLVLPIPPSTNGLYATVMVYSKRQRRLVPRRVKSKAAKEYAEWVKLAIVAQYGLLRLKPPIRIDGVLYAPDWRTIDLDNLKLAVDSLAAVLGFNDRRVVHNAWDKVIGKGQQPRLELTVEGQE